MLVEEQAAAAAPVSVEEVKAFLRVEGSHEDALIAGLVRSATGLCEAFTGLELVAREASEIVPASAAWRRLSLTPVRAVTGLSKLEADGTEAPLAAAEYAVDIDANGDGWVRVTGMQAGRVRVTYSAGQASDWNGIPEPLRQGIVRLAGHLYTHRDGADGTGPPAAVTALWRPWRRMRLYA